ncbi:hypothetical protein FSP39_005876 [Pinctada imbricata]|uniref:B box-type domain-containing protein n=1 Tax=Pinctada imbricata TaxID=66713 RepID=A0AA88YMX1_PINIB|nr:hypothetical protein FSP39_005876 [Pinctada imbricata]
MAFASSRIGAQEAIIKPCDLCEDGENVNWFCKDCDQILCDRCKRTCDRNICSNCLSSEHKKHDFVGLRELQSKVQKQLDDVIKEKETEKQTMTKNYDYLVQHEDKSGYHLKEQYAKIDDRVKAIKLAADEEGEILKESLSSIKHQQDEEVKEGKQKIHTLTGLYNKEIQSVRQELRLQTTSSLNGFVKESITKLKKLKPISIAIPDEQQLPFEEQVEDSQIRETIGKLIGSQYISEIEITKGGKDGAKCNVLSNLEIVRTFNVDKFRHCYSMCLSPDGSIWIGGIGYVYKMSSDCSTVLHQIPTRNSYVCYYIACLQSGDAVVSYGGGVPYVDRFTSDGRRVEFTELPRRKNYDKAVNTNDEVVINVDGNYIYIFSNKGKKLREIEVDGGIKTFCIDREGHIIVANRGSPNLTILDGRCGEVITLWRVSMSDIQHLTCNRYGNILATNWMENVYVLSKDGDVKKTYTVDFDGIMGICVNKEDHLLILMRKNDKYEIHVAKYLE